MSLYDRLQKQPAGKTPSGTPSKSEEHKKEDQYNELKSKVHYRLLDLLDLSRLAGADDAQLFQDIKRGIDIILAEENIALILSEKERLAKDIRDELMGYGPLEQLLSDSTVSDILVNGYNNIYVERKGKLQRSPVRFKDNAHLLKIIEKISSGVGRRVDESCPMVDARLPDGSRVNAIIAPLALDGPALSIRKFSKDPYKVDDLINFGTITEDIAKILEAMVKARLNILISGGTGSGKTTFLNILSSFIPNDETDHYHRRRRRITTPAGPCGASRDRARPIWRAPERSPSGIWCATPCACARNASSWGRSARPRLWICSRP